LSNSLDPVIMRDEELAAILEEFREGAARARPRKESVHVSRPKAILPPSDLPFKRKSPKRWR
jgi:hypothetical protein